MTFVEKYFRSQILWGTAQSVCSCLTILCKTEIGQFQVAFFIDQNILWLQVSVDNVLGMQVFEHHANLCGIELSMLLIQFSLSSQIREEFTTRDVVEQEVKVTRVL